MTKGEGNYEEFERDTLAVLFSLGHFRVYLLSKESFTIISDQKSLKDALKKKDLHGSLEQWLECFYEYELTIQ